MARAIDLRGTAEAVIGNITTKARIQHKEVECAIIEIRESAPGKVDARIGYIRYASEEFKDTMIG